MFCFHYTFFTRLLCQFTLLALIAIASMPAVAETNESYSFSKQNNKPPALLIQIPTTDNNVSNAERIRLAENSTHDIAEIQRMLKALGYDPGNLAGENGPQTTKAIRTFQLDQGFETTGILSKDERALLIQIYDLSFGSHNVTEENLDTIGGVGLNTNDNSDDQQNEFMNPYVVRDIILRDNNILIDRISGLTHPTLLSVFSKPNLLNDTLLTSIPIVGCSKDQFSVYGYYNAGLHVWILLRLELHTRNVVDIRLSAGFSPKAYQEETAWYDFVQDTGSVLESLKEATKIQISAFEDLFPHQDCSDFEDLDRLFSQDEALYNLSVNRGNLAKNPEALIQEMKSKISNKYNIEDDNIIKNVSIIQDVLGLKYLSIFTSSKNPNLVFVQGWDEGLNGLQLREQGYGLLYEVK